MSSLYRSAISSRIAKLPQLPPIDGPEDDDETEETDALGDLPTPVPAPGLGPPAMPRRTPAAFRSRFPKSTPNPAFAPISASAYFSQALQVSVKSTQLDARIYYTPPAASSIESSVMICHHGAGYSGLSFACFAKEVLDMTQGECGVLAFDVRRHGRTTCGDPNGDDENLSIEVLTNDLVELLKEVFPDPAACPSFVLVGHSMGGSVVVRACPLLIAAKYRVSGIAVLDVVEGTAIEALPFMNNILNARPDGFGSMEEAIEWHVKTNTIHNPISARISIPSIMKPISDPPNPEHPAVTWRTPLRSTAPYWSSWFTGLSNLFLGVRSARLLVLAGTDRLDQPLMIGQMQGKFQLAVVPGDRVGHMLHEDDPTRLAEILVEFWRRNDRVVVGIKKVGEL